jgi:hypothetical protein
MVITKCHLVVTKKKSNAKNVPKSPDLKEFFSATGDI